ncbi:MAG: hypothetical protein MUO53_04600 [Maribacter sp.]|nr:hypothetical protein [Maribacter sp.]
MSGNIIYKKIYSFGLDLTITSQCSRIWEQDAAVLHCAQKGNSQIATKKILWAQPAHTKKQKKPPTFLKGFLRSGRGSKSDDKPLEIVAFVIRKTLGEKHVPRFSRNAQEGTISLGQNISGPIPYFNGFRRFLCFGF